MLEVPDLGENHTAHKIRVWEYLMAELMKTKRVLEGNLCNLFTRRMSLCDSDIKNQVKASWEYITLEMSLDSMGLISVINKLVYTSGTKNLNIRHNKAMLQMNLMTLYHEKLQDTQEFSDQYMTMRKVCSELYLKFERCEEDARAGLKEKGINKPVVPSSRMLLLWLEGW